MTNTQNVKPNCGCPANRPCAFTGFGHTDRAVRGVKPENDTLTKAVAYLGAKEVAPGRYATKNLLGIGWWTYSRERVEALVNDIADPRVLWWPALNAVKMPPWWTPQTQYAIRNGNMVLPEVHLDREQRAEREARGWFRITVDLATGEEVLC